MEREAPGRAQGAPLVRLVVREAILEVWHKQRLTGWKDQPAEEKVERYTLRVDKGAKSLKQERAWLAQSAQLEGAGEGGQVTQSRPRKLDSRSRASF